MYLASRDAGHQHVRCVRLEHLMPSGIAKSVREGIKTTGFLCTNLYFFNVTRPFIQFNVGSFLAFC